MNHIAVLLSSICLFVVLMSFKIVNNKCCLFCILYENAVDA